ncbi:MAG: penicillin-binding protein 2 [Candidatus Neomarinimicrobiota bacterium]|nr:penicillin-binding protein 2 [Candidatus Neomarinimicrobiota bacterium]
MLKIENKADIYTYRVLFFILCFLMTILIGRYYHLQVIEYDRHFSKSQINRVKAVTTYASRGLIFDRNGELLVDNYPTYVLTVTPYKLEDKEKSFEALSTILNTETDELHRRYKKYYRGRMLPTIIAKNLSFKQISEIEERKLDFNAFNYSPFNERIYPSSFSHSHILGYLKEVDRDTVPSLDKSLLYRAGELIGWQGIEKQYERELRYSKGVSYLEVDTYGREIFELEDGKVIALPGDNLHLSIDSRLQQFVKNLLGDQKGSVIMSHIGSGEILAMVSSPSYDLDIYRGTTSEEEWDDILKNPDKPLLNRSIAGLYPPGSTLKLITTFNLLENNVISDSDSVICSGIKEYGGIERRCWNENGHGSTDLKKAISESCNIYFYEKVQLISLEDWVSTAKIFGFNEATDIDLPSEKIGLVPDKNFFTKQYGRWGWSERGVLLNLTLGQGDLLITPIQSLRFINHIATRGQKTPRLRLNLNSQLSYYDPIEYSDNTWDYVENALFKAVNDDFGTARRAMPINQEIPFFAKTGTAQNPHGEPHAWFVGFFEFQGEKYSIVTIIENGGGGATVASPVAGEIVSYFINNNTYIANK